MNGLKMLSPGDWKEYELLDSGDFEKLERFGSWIVRRPEPQAIWMRSLPDKDWDAAHASFIRTRGSEEGGQWRLAQGMPSQWWLGYGYKEMSFRMRLGLTSFKHVGVFPEQAANWDFIYESVHRLAAAGNAQPRVLNLFAYTGGATLAALAAGAQATHVDSVKQVVGWARENMEASGTQGARWIVDDALKFLRREVRRQSVYEGIILDPPAYGRGPEGEKWILEEGLPEVMRLCAQLLAPKGSFLILNLYSMGFSSLLAKGLVNQSFAAHGGCGDEEFGELYLSDRGGKKLPLSVFYRFFRE